MDLFITLLFILTYVSMAAGHGGIPQEVMNHLSGVGVQPERASFLVPFSRVASNMIGNVPTVTLILEVWKDISEGALTALAILTTLAGNLLSSASGQT